jgi:carbonic anhydrase
MKVPDLLRKSCVLLLLAIPVLPAGGQPELSADAALARLLEGNRRYVKHKEEHPDESMARRKELIAGQHPFAVILGCADSRVPPELLFDEGLGDLFVIRVAGNVVDDAILGSIEYAVEHLHTNLIVVLGHESCGAVSAAVHGENSSGHLNTIVDSIQLSVKETANMSGDKIHNCVIANVRRVARQIRESEPVLKQHAGNGLKVVSADYALDTGVVSLLERER